MLVPLLHTFMDTVPLPHIATRRIVLFANLVWDTDLLTTQYLSLDVGKITTPLVSVNNSVESSTFLTPSILINPLVTRAGQYYDIIVVL